MARPKKINTCIICGKQFYSTFKRLYCCEECHRTGDSLSSQFVKFLQENGTCLSEYESGEYEQKPEKAAPSYCCPNNDGVLKSYSCSQRGCGKCGWNPEEAQRRIKKLREVYS